MTKQIHLNEKNFSPTEIELIEWLAERRKLAGIVERAVHEALQSNIYPIVKDAKQQLNITDL